MKSFQFSLAIALSFLFIGFVHNPIACQSPTTAPTSQPTEKAGIGLLDRVVEKRVFPKNIGQLNGLIHFNICIDRNGNIVYAKYNRKGSTITDRDAIAKTKFEANPSAPTEKKCGQWTMKFEDN